jgi:MoxR-like ATPase
LKILITYPTQQEERQVVANWQAGFNARRLDEIQFEPLTESGLIENCRREVQQVVVEPGVQNYIVEIARRTREHPSLLWGASPRASVALLLASKALAAMRGRDFATPDDVRDIAHPAMRHRILLHSEAEIEGITPDLVLDEIIQSIEVPR